MIFVINLEFEAAVDDIIDLTSSVSESVQESGLSSGQVTVFVPGATGAVTTIEYEPGLVQDMKELLERLAPMQRDYFHNQRWHDNNGHSHLRASLLGPSLTVPFSDGRLLLGTWQQIVFLELDNRPRRRRVIVQMLGEP